jgi:hypothetical protein
MDEDPIWFCRLRSGLAVAFLTAASLGACAHVQAPAAAPQVVCLPLKQYDPAEQKAMAAQLQTLPSTSPVAMAMVDYLAMRDADRACQASK